MSPGSRRTRHACIVDTVMDGAKSLDALINHALDVRLDRRVGLNEDSLDLGVVCVRLFEFA